MGMRRGRDNGLLKDDNGKVIGINLGADFTAEHEWGINKLQDLFGISESGFGIERRTITKIPNGKRWFSNNEEINFVKLVDTKKHTVLIVSERVNEEHFNLKDCYLDYRPKGSEELLTAWDEKSFAISGVSKEQREAIREMYNAMQRKDLAIWLGGGHVFQRAGLVVAIASIIPADRKQMMYDADVDRDKLTKAADKTGIASRLEKAGLKHFALCPKWKNEAHREVSSKYNVVFWLNPMEQRLNNSGWFTVENLDEWIEGNGPVPKKEA